MVLATIPEWLSSIESELQNPSVQRQELVNLLQQEFDRRVNGELTLDECRSLIIQKVRELLAGKGKRVLLIMSPPGSGKSAIVTEIVNRYLTPQGKYVAWFGSQHSQFDDFKDSRRDWLEMWGRVFTLDSDEKTREEILRRNNCVLAKKAIALAKKGYDVPKTLCAHCHIGFGNCGYYQQFIRRGHKFYVHQHLFTPYWRDADLVVIDEFSPAIFLDRLTITEEQLSTMSRKTKSVVFKALGLLFHGEREYTGRRLYNALDEYVGKLRQNRGFSKSLAEVAAELNHKVGEIDLSLQSFKDKDIPKVLPRRLCVDFPRLLAKEISKWQLGEDFNGQISVSPGQMSVLPVNYSGKRELTVTFRKRIDPSILQNKTIIILTATGDPELIMKLLEIPKEDFEVFRPSIRIAKEVEIFQITGAMNGALTMSKQAAKKRVVKQAKELMSDPRVTKTCLIAHFPYEKDLAKELGLTPSDYVNKKVERHDSGHFWSIKGTNAFEEHEQLLVIGNPTPNPQDLLRQARAFYYDARKLDETPLKEEKAYLCALPNGKQVTTEVRKYKDERINRYLEPLREGELLQSIYRIRPLEAKKRERITVLLFTAQQIDGIKVELVTFKNLHQIVKEQTIQTIVNSAKYLLSKRQSFCTNDLIHSTDLGQSTVYKYSKDMQMRLNLKVTSIRTQTTGKDGRTQLYRVQYYSF